MVDSMAKTEKPLPDVQVGDEWADNDSRFGRPKDSKHDKVFVVTCIASPYVFGYWRHPSGVMCGTRRILQRRFKPNSTGYALVKRLGQ